MLAKRVIPCMDVKDGRVVKGVNFVNLRDAGDPIELAQRYDEERADEVIFLDITATSDDRATTVDLASRASEQLHLPYCVGGGFRSVADIRTMIAAGADKVSVNSAAVADPSLITSAAAAFGSQAILCAIDAKQVDGQPEQMGGLRCGRAQGHGHRRGRLGAGGGPVRGGGDPAHQHGSRRQPRRLRLRAHSRRRACGGHPGHRLGRGGQARALRPRRHRGRGRCRAGCKRLPLRRAFRPSSEGAYARPGYPRAGCRGGAALVSGANATTGRSTAILHRVKGSHGRAFRAAESAATGEKASNSEVSSWVASSSEALLRIEPGCWLAPFRSRAPHALETGDVFRIRWLFAIQNAVGRHRWRSDPVFGRSDGMVWDRPEDVHAPAFRLRRREARGGCRLRLRKQPQYIDRVRIIGMNIPGIAYNADGLVSLHRAGCRHARGAHDGVDERGVRLRSRSSAARRCSGAAAAGSYGTRAPPRATCRSSWSCVTTAMPTRCSRSFIRRVRPAIPASAPASTARSPASRSRSERSVQRGPRIPLMLSRCIIGVVRMPIVPHNIAFDYGMV